MHLLREKLLNIVERHQQKAEYSQYDRKVAIVAVGTVWQIIDAFDWSGNMMNDVRKVIEVLTKLRDKYNDTSGQYSSGKGEIGSLLKDIEALEDEMKRDLASALGVTKSYRY